MAPGVMWPRRTAPEIRTVEVVSPSRFDEAGKVVIAAGYIVLCLLYVYAFEQQARRDADAAKGSATLLPYQVLFRDLPAAEQRVFRAMQEGSGEAVRVRTSSGNWPTAGALAASEVPPFALDVLDKEGYRWADRREGLVVNYLGVPSAPVRAPAFLVMMREPDPVNGERPPPPSVIDEEHQLLGKDVLLHVTYWKRSATNLDGRMVVDPARQGWQQIRLKTLFEEMDQR